MVRLAHVGAGQACRDSFADLVLLPGLEGRAFMGIYALDGREANDARLSQTAGNPGPNRTDTLQAIWEGGQEKEHAWGAGGEPPVRRRHLLLARLLM